MIIRGHSGDTDINIIVNSLILENKANSVFVDFNLGDNRKVLCFGDLSLESTLSLVMIMMILECNSKQLKLV